MDVIRRLPPRVAFDIADHTLRAHIAALLAGSNGIVITATTADADVIVADGLTDPRYAAGVPIIVIGNRATVASAMANGAAGGLSPKVSADELRAVIEAVQFGFTCVDRLTSVAAPRGSHVLADEADAAHDALTPRETEVLALLKTGASNKHIARALDISVHTAKFHVAAIIAKLGANGRTDAVARALRLTPTMV